MDLLDGRLANPLDKLSAAMSAGLNTPTTTGGLAAAKEDKIYNLSNKKSTLLLGMNDGDTPIVTEGTIRESAADGTYYDANELPHPGFTADKSSIAMQKQDMLTSAKVGKPVEQLTEQDRLDVANWQQIQKLADIVNGPGVWEAPLARGVEKTDLTGRQAPLNIPVTTNIEAADKHGRLLGQIGTNTGIDVTTTTAHNPELNARYVANGGTEVYGGSAGNKAKPVTGLLSADMVNQNSDTRSSRDLLGRAGNFAAGIAQGAITTGVLDTVDFVAEAAGFDGIGDEKQKAAMAKKITGYDSSSADRYMKANEAILAKNYHDIPEKEKGWFDKAVEDFSGKDGTLNNLNKVISNMSGKDFTDIMSNAFADTDTTAYSIGMLIGMAAGTKGLGLGKVALKSGATAQDAITAVKTAENITRAEKAAAIAAINEEAYTQANMLQKAVNQVGKNAGLLTVNAGQVNNQIDEFEHNMGRPATAQEKFEKYFLNLGGLAIDRAVELSALKGVLGKDTLDGLNKLVKYTPASVSGAIVKSAVERGLKIGAGGVLEFPTETAQTFIEEYNKVDASTEKGQKILQSKVPEILAAGFSGAAGAVHMGGIGAVVDGSSSGSDKVFEQLDRIRNTVDARKAEREAQQTNKPAADDISKLEEEVANVAGADFKNRLAASLTQAIQSGDEEAATRLTAVAKAYKEQIAATTQAATREDGTLSVKTLGSNPAALQAYFDSIAEAKDETVREELISKLINDKDLRDPEQYNMSEEQLKGYADVLRGSAAVANELNGIAATNNMIVDTGFATPAGVYEGMIEVFTKASNGDKGALAQANRFAGLQAQKQEALAAGVADAQEQAMGDVEAMARETKLSSDVVLQALAYLGNRTIKSNGANIKDETPFIKAAVAFMNARGAKIDTSANILEQGKQAKAQYKGSALDKDLGKSYKFKYANPMGRNEGNYELNKFEVISDLQQAKMTEGTLVPTGISKLQAAVQAETNTINSAIEKVQGRQAKLNEILTAFTGVQTKQEPAVSQAKEQVPVVETVEAPAEVKKPAKKVVKSKKQTIAQQISAATQAEPDTDKRTTIASTIMKTAKDANAEKDYYGSLSEEDLAEIERASKEAAPKPSTTVAIKVDESKLNSAGQKAVARLKKLAENGITPRLKVAYDKLMADVDSGLRGGRSKYVQQAIVKQARLDNKAYAKRVARNDAKEQARLTLQEAAAQEISKAGITNKSTAADIQKELSSRKQLRNATRQAINKTLEAAITTEDKAKVAKSIMADKAAVALDSAVIKQLEALLRSGAKAKELLKPSPVAGLTISNKKVPQGAVKAKPSINKIVEVDESSTEPLSSLDAAVLVDNDTLTRLVAEVEALNPANNASHNKEMVTQIAYGTPLVFSKGKGTANENVAVALHMAILNTLDEVSAELTTLDDEKISKLYGVEAVKNEAAKNQLKELGVPAKLIAERIGLDVLTLLGLKRKISAEDSKELYSNLAVSLGLYAIELAKNKGLIEVSEPTVKQIAAILGNEVASDAVNYYIKMKSKNSGLLAAKEYDALNAHVGSNGQIRKDVKFTKPDLRKVKGNIRRSTLVKAPTEVVDAQKSYTAMTWKIKGLDGHKAMKEVLALGQAALMRAQGWLTADELSNISAERRDAVVSKNEAIKRSVNALYRAAKKVSSGEEINEMWFDWFVAKNGRLMIDSAGLNPQGDKLHRHAMGIKGTESLVTKENGHVFKLGVAQAFGFDTDKKSTAASMKFAEQLLTKDGLEAIEKEWAKYLQELKTGGSTRKLKVQIGDTAIELKTEIISHTADGIEAVRQYVQAEGKEFTTTLTLEMDGVTNGFALKVLQFATSLDKAFGKDGKTTAEEWMNKVGLEIDSDGTEMAAKLESKVVDSYKTLAKQMTEKMLDKAARNIEEKYESVLGRNPDVVAKEVAALSKALGALQDKNGVTKWARDIFKPPFMTFNYGAGFAKIREELGASIIDRLMTLVEADTHTDEMSALMKMLTGESTTEKAKEVLMTNRLDKIEYLDSNVRQHLEALIAVSYGKVVTDVMSAEFGDMVEANQHIMVGMKLVHRLWEISAKEELAKIAKAEGGLTIDAIERVYEALVDKFPIIKGPLGDLSTGVAVFKTKLQESAKDGEPSPYGKGGAYVTRDGKSTTRSVARVAKMVTEAASAALVVPIHTLDAAIMSTATTDKNVLQVFDAIVTDISSAEAVAKDYNEKMLELSLSWNYVEEVYNTVIKAIEQADKATLAKVVEADQKSFKAVKESIKALRKLAEDNKKVKQELLQSELTVEQMVLTKDGAYIHNGANALEVLNKMLAEADIDTALKGCK